MSKDDSLQLECARKVLCLTLFFLCHNPETKALHSHSGCIEQICINMGALTAKNAWHNMMFNVTCTTASTRFTADMPEYTLWSVVAVLEPIYCFSFFVRLGFRIFFFFSAGHCQCRANELI